MGLKQAKSGVEFADSNGSGRSGEPTALTGWIGCSGRPGAMLRDNGLFRFARPAFFGENHAALARSPSFTGPVGLPGVRWTDDDSVTGRVSRQAPS